MKHSTSILSLACLFSAALAVEKRQFGGNDPDSAAFPGSAQSPFGSPGGNGQSPFGNGNGQQPSGGSNSQSPFGSNGQQPSNNSNGQSSFGSSNGQQPSGGNNQQSPFGDGNGQQSPGSGPNASPTAPATQRPTASQNPPSSSQTIPASILERMSSLFNFGQDIFSRPTPSSQTPVQSVRVPSNSASQSPEQPTEIPTESDDLNANAGYKGKALAACAVAAAVACALSGSI